MISQIYTIIAFLLFITFSILHLFTLMGNKDVYKGITKGTLMPLLLLFYCIFTQHISIFIILALLFSFFGDVGLFIADTHPSFYQKGSILSFALSHVFYTLYILPTQAHPTLIFISFIGAICILLLFYLKVIHPFDNSIKAFLFLYAVIITMMATSAFISVFYYQSMGSFLLFTGALFFVFSDFLISKQILLDNKKDELAIMISYILAQFLLIVGIILLEGVN